MKGSAYHLNLLMQSERVSSSPIRFRVMLPILSILACIGLLIWWAILGSQLMLTQANVRRSRNDITERKKAHEGVLAKTARITELNAELSQLDTYRDSIVRRGGMLTSLAEEMPIKIQLVKLELPPPPAPQMVKRGVLLFGPTGYVERAEMVFTGRATKETPIISLMESLKSDTFTNDLIITRNPQDPDPSPRIRSYRQDTSTTEGGTRLTAFDIIYRLKERRFGL